MTDMRNAYKILDRKFEVKSQLGIRLVGRIILSW